jgi:hypothetical protein
LVCPLLHSLPVIVGPTGGVLLPLLDLLVGALLHSLPGMVGPTGGSSAPTPGGPVCHGLSSPSQPACHSWTYWGSSAPTPGLIGLSSPPQHVWHGWTCCRCWRQFSPHSWRSRVCLWSELSSTACLVWGGICAPISIDFASSGMSGYAD